MKVHLIFIFVCLSFGCATASFKMPTQVLEPGIYQVNSGDRVSFDELIERLRPADYVLLAESHDSKSDHAKQVKIYDALTQTYDDKICLGMEMFQNGFQAPLDAYIAGTISEEKMLEQTEWKTRWGFEVEQYAPLWRRAKETKNQVIALNAPRELTKRVAKVGRAKLTPEERAQLPMMATGNERYRRFLKAVFASHGAMMDDQTLQRFFEAQLLWDETMADTAVRARQTGCKVAIIVGRGHVERDYGIPSRLRRRVGQEDGKVISVVPVSSTDLPTWERLRGARFADYIWVD